MKIILLLSTLALVSCGVSGTVNVPLPDQLGGGSLPITLHPDK